MHPLSARDVQPLERELSLHPLSAREVQPLDRELSLQIFYMYAHMCPRALCGHTRARNELNTCQQGTCNPSVGSLGCTPCQQGTYNPSTGSSTCTPCQPGTYNPSTGSTTSAACTPCQPGTYNPMNGSTACSPCPPGTYNPSTRSSVCIPCQANTFCPDNGASQGLPCPSGLDSSPGATACTPPPCIPSPWNANTFSCYSTEGKVGIILSYSLSLISAVLFPVKMRIIYKYRKGKLQAKGIRPTLRHIIFFRSALARAIALQPLIRAQDDASLMPPPLGGAASACEVAQATSLHQSHQIEAMLRLNADLYEKQLEQDRKMKELEAALLLQQSASSK
jgi:hypothetical protein